MRESEEVVQLMKWLVASNRGADDVTSANTSIYTVRILASSTNIVCSEVTCGDLNASFIFFFYM